MGFQKRVFFYHVYLISKCKTKSQGWEEEFGSLTFAEFWLVCRAKGNVPNVCQQNQKVYSYLWYLPRK